jgi:hypothetical protein
MKDYDALVHLFKEDQFVVIEKSFAKQLVKKQDDLALNAYLRAGNRKLPADTAIFNMGPAMDCPSEKLGLCQAINKDGKVICYALKAERLYPDVLPFRKRQAKFWKDVDPESFAADFLLINALKSRKYTALRINEAGDFYGQDCIAKADRIAEILNHYGVAVYVYTARSDLNFSKVKHMVVNGSGFRKPGVTNEFKYIETRADRPKDYALCPGNCRICDRCQKHDKLTAVVKH